MGAAKVILVAALVWPAVAGARGTCVVSGRKVVPFVAEVAPKGARPFKLRVDGVPASIATDGAHAPARVTVRGPLAFAATVAADAIPARTRRAVDALSGLAHLAPATEKLTVRADPLHASRVEADVRLGGVELRGLTLPCEALTLDEVAPPKPLLVDDGGGEHASPAGALLHLRAAAGAGPSMVVAVDEPAALDLRVTEHERGWARVTARWADGTTIAGWAARAELAPVSRHGSLGDALPTTAACTQAPTARANERIVTARVAPGTAIYAARYLSPWAKVADGRELRVRVRPKDDWAEIVAAPGVASVDDCAASTVLLDAWVPRAAVALPSDEATADANTRPRVR